LLLSRRYLKRGQGDATPANRCAGANTKGALQAGVAKCSEGAAPWITLKPLKKALAPRKTQQLGGSFDLTIETPRTTFEGQMLPDNGLFHLVKLKGKSSIDIYGFDQDITIDLDDKDFEPRPAVASAAFTTPRYSPHARSRMTSRSHSRIRHLGDFGAQCRYAWGKIKRLLAKHGATVDNIDKVITYVTDVRYFFESGKCRTEAYAGATQPAGTFLVINALAWPGMLIEVDVTASTPE